LKAFLATILLGLMLLPFGGSYLFLELEKSKAKIYAQTAMAEEENPVQMVWLKFTKEQIKNDLRWEHDGEFEYNGQMYDISKREERGDTTHFYCYWDKFETLINAKLADLIALHTNGQNKDQKDDQLIVSLYKAVYLFNDKPISILTSTAELSFQSFNPLRYINADLPEDSPPPRHV
jgi:hypothetical protein